MPARARTTGFGYIAPAFALLGLVLFAPVVYGGWFSLQDIRYGAPTGFGGLRNYARLFDDPELGWTVLRTLVHTGLAVAISLVTSLAIAVWIDGLGRRLGFFVQIVVIVPWIISTVVAALLFRWVFVSDIGPAAYLLERLGIGAWQPLNSGPGAMALLVIVSVWKRVGYVVIVLLAGLKGIGEELTEAARIDGASAWQSFLWITLPLLKTPLLLVTIVLTLANINTVETPLVVTGGGPADATRVLAIDVYERAFTQFDLGGATALALLIFAANIVLVITYVRLTKWRA